MEEKTDLDIFGITDHDSVAAVRIAWDLYARRGYRFKFLPGVEVTNQGGHLLVYFPHGRIFDVPSLRPFWWTVHYVRQRGGICIPAHPVYPPWLVPSIRRGLEDGEVLDGVEVINAAISAKAQVRLNRIGHELSGRLAVVGNSDAHDQSAIGAAYTSFPGKTIDDYLQALIDHTTEPVFVHRPKLHRHARRFTQRRSMTRPSWVGSIWRELRAERGRSDIFD